MPLLPAHPPFQVLNYRTPVGARNDGDLAFLIDDNTVNLGFIGELMIYTTHSRTHIDTLAHYACGLNNIWHGGFSAKTQLGDFGPTNADASDLPPMFRRGVIVNIPALLGVPHLQPSQPVGRADIEAAPERQGTTIEQGDVVLIRTGTMSHWPNAKAMEASAGSGLVMDGAEWLVECGISVIGNDNVALEAAPLTVPGAPLPVAPLPDPRTRYFDCGMYVSGRHRPAAGLRFSVRLPIAADQGSHRLDGPAARHRLGAARQSVVMRQGD